jgi:hypothetical protein
MLFAKRAFQVAGIYGATVILLGYVAYLLGFGDEASAVVTNRPEFVHGFFLVTFAWQIAFLIIATDPVRYRLLMLAAMIEKFPFTLAVLLLFAQGETTTMFLTLGLIDGVLGVLFGISYVLTDDSTSE